MFAHLALGKSLSKGREFDLDNRGRALMESLHSITGAALYKTSDFVSLSPQDELRMCSSPADCHPSPFGQEVYGAAVAKMVLASGLLNEGAADASGHAAK